MGLDISLIYPPSDIVHGLTLDPKIGAKEHKVTQSTLFTGPIMKRASNRKSSRSLHKLAPLNSSDHIGESGSEFSSLSSLSSGYEDIERPELVRQICAFAQRRDMERSKTLEMSSTRGHNAQYNKAQAQIHTQTEVQVQAQCVNACQVSSDKMSDTDSASSLELFSDTPSMRRLLFWTEYATLTSISRPNSSDSESESFYAKPSVDAESNLPISSPEEKENGGDEEKTVEDAPKDAESLAQAILKVDATAEKVCFDADSDQSSGSTASLDSPGSIPEAHRRGFGFHRYANKMTRDSSKHILKRLFDGMFGNLRSGCANKSKVEMTDETESKVEMTVKSKSKVEMTVESELKVEMTVGKQLSPITRSRHSSITNVPTFRDHPRALRRIAKGIFTGKITENEIEACNAKHKADRLLRKVGLRKRLFCKPEEPSPEPKVQINEYSSLLAFDKDKTCILPPNIKPNSPKSLGKREPRSVLKVKHNRNLEEESANLQSHDQIDDEDLFEVISPKDSRKHQKLRHKALKEQLRSYRKANPDFGFRNSLNSFFRK